MRTNHKYVNFKDGCIDFHNENQDEITRKHLILCFSVSDKWQKTPKKVGGPVGKEGVLSEVNRCRNAGKSAKT